MKTIFKKKSLVIYLVILLIVSIFFIRGYYTTNLYMPKPVGHIRIEIPNHKYTTLNNKFPYSMEYSKHATIKLVKENKYWINIFYPKFNATIHLTYAPINNNLKLLKQYWNDAYKLLSAHHSMASEIKESIVINKSGIKVTTVELFGESIASQYQFFTTDYKKHFLRGVLYFNMPPNQEYLLPMTKFIKKDILHMIDTLKWKK